MKRIITAILLMSLTLPATNLTALAASVNPFSGVNCTDASSSALCQQVNSQSSQKQPTNVIYGSGGIINVATNLIALIAGMAAIIIIIIGGIKYTTSGGNAEKIQAAKKTITYAVIGLVIIVIAKLIVSYVIANA